MLIMPPARLEAIAAHVLLTVGEYTGARVCAVVVACVVKVSHQMSWQLQKDVVQALAQAVAARELLF